MCRSLLLLCSSLLSSASRPLQQLLLLREPCLCQLYVACLPPACRPLRARRVPCACLPQVCALTAPGSAHRKWIKALVPAALQAKALEDMSGLTTRLSPVPPSSPASPTLQGSTTGRARLAHTRTPRERTAGGLLPNSSSRSQPLGTASRSAGANGQRREHVRAEDAATTGQVLCTHVRRAAHTAKFVSNARRTLGNGEVHDSSNACGLHVSEALAQCHLDGSGSLQYLRSCAELNTRPNPAVLYQLTSAKLVLQDAPLERRRAPLASEHADSDLYHDELYPEALALSCALAANTLVQHIDISSPLCVDQGGRVLVEAIASANAVRRLRLCFKTLSAPAVSSLAAFLTPGARTSKLAHLDLASTNIANKGVTQLSLALVGNSVLTSLCLRKCNVTASGATALAQVLAGGRAGALAELDVSWNHISPAGTQALLLALAGASAEEACQYAAPVVPAAARLLPRVAANGGGKTSAGAHGADAAASADGLSASRQPNVTLTSLDLAWNRIGGKEGQREGQGVYALAMCLAKNSCLQRLDVSHAALDKVPPEAALLGTALIHGAAALKILRLEGNRVGSCSSLLRALMHRAPLLKFCVDAEPAHANPEQLLASLLPIRSLQDNASGRYLLDLVDPPQRAVAEFIAQRALADGDESCRGERLNGEHVRLSQVHKLLQAFQDSPVPSPRSPQLLQLDYLAPPVQGGEMASENTLQQALGSIRQSSAAILRLAVLRTLSSDHVVDTMGVLQLLSALDPGLYHPSPCVRALAASQTLCLAASLPRCLAASLMSAVLCISSIARQL